MISSRNTCDGIWLPLPMGDGMCDCDRGKSQGGGTKKKGRTTDPFPNFHSPRNGDRKMWRPNPEGLLNMAWNEALLFFSEKIHQWLKNWWDGGGRQDWAFFRFQFILSSSPYLVRQEKWMVECLERCLSLVLRSDSKRDTKEFNPT